MATASYRRRSYICRRDNWVSEWVSELVIIRLKFRFWPSATYCLFRSILVVWHSHSIHSWVLTFSDFWVTATNTSCYHPCSYCGYCLLYDRRQSHLVTGISECVIEWVIDGKLQWNSDLDPDLTQCFPILLLFFWSILSYLPYGLVQFCCFWKVYSCLFTPIAFGSCYYLYT